MDITGIFTAFYDDMPANDVSKVVSLVDLACLPTNLELSLLNLVFHPIKWISIALENFSDF